MEGVQEGVVCSIPKGMGALDAAMLDTRRFYSALQNKWYCKVSVISYDNNLLSHPMAMISYIMTIITV